MIRDVLGIIAFQPWIREAAQSGLPTHIAAMESPTLCVPMTSSLRFWNWNGRFVSTY
jgi:hypothetical protein